MSGVYQIYNPINNKRYIRYAFKFKNGRCDKIKATFVKITEEEYKNKTKK